MADEFAPTPRPRSPNTVVVAHTSPPGPPPAATPPHTLAGEKPCGREPGPGSPHITTLPKTVGRSRGRFPNRRHRQLGSHKLWGGEEGGHRPRRFFLQSAARGVARPTRGAERGVSRVLTLTRTAAVLNPATHVPLHACGCGSALETASGARGRHPTAHRSHSPADARAGGRPTRPASSARGGDVRAATRRRTHRQDFRAIATASRATAGAGTQAWGWGLLNPCAITPCPTDSTAQGREPAGLVIPQAAPHRPPRGSRGTDSTADIASRGTRGKLYAFQDFLHRLRRFSRFFIWRCFAKLRPRASEAGRSHHSVLRSTRSGTHQLLTRGDPWKGIPSRTQE
ncbi:hypothetical protein ETAA1_35140 [Urbifossiella limnaea]|uniref:Uncharacterized protein n=1 Tax=Urbifossiella limnaea TaxID=2528023 RepID=A0A517XVK1_9BACT|nr:hypothetical protein ETAA1_35140 [Urbifossiella limnaea]